MTIDKAVLKKVETLLKQHLETGYFTQSFSQEDGGDEEGEEVIEVDFVVRNVRAEGEKTILFDCDSTVRCPPYAQEDAQDLIAEEWVPQAIAKVRAEVSDYEILSRDGEITWDEE